MQGFAPRKHPRQACSLDCIAKLRFAFQPALQAIQLRQTFRSSRQAHLLRQPAIIFRQQPSFLQSKSQPSTIQHNHPSGVSRPTLTRRPSFLTGPHNFPSASTQQQPAGFTCRLPIPSPLHFSFFLFSFFLFPPLIFHFSFYLSFLTSAESF